MKFSDSNSGMQSIGELWDSLGKVSSHIVEDNANYGDIYPSDVRILQLTSIKALVAEIESHHNRYLQAKG